MARKKKKTIPELCVWKGCFVKWYWYTGYWYLRFQTKSVSIVYCFDRRYHGLSPSSKLPNNYHDLCFFTFSADNTPEVYIHICPWPYSCCPMKKRISTFYAFDFLPCMACLHSSPANDVLNIYLTNEKTLNEINYLKHMYIGCQKGQKKKKTCISLTLTISPALYHLRLTFWPASCLFVSGSFAREAAIIRC